MIEKKFLSTKEVARRWNMSPHTLKKWRLEGKGPQPSNITGRTSYSVEDIEEFERNAKHKRRVKKDEPNE